MADSVNTCGGVKSGWWRASPSQLEEVSKTTQDNIMAGEKTDRQSVPSHLSQNSNNAESAFNKESSLKHVNQVTKTDLAHANKDESENESRDIEVARKSNSHLRYNSLSELIEQLKRENAASNAEQNASKEIEVSKCQSSGNESGKIEPQPAASDGPIARCPKPLQPGSYWYSKQFSSPDEKELPSTSTQEVRNVLAALTSNKKSHARKLEVTETDPQMKLEEISTDESSETSQSYSTDTITESSDDKLKSGDKSTTLEDALSVSKELGETELAKAGNIKEDNDPAISTSPDTEETLKTKDLNVESNNDKAINKGSLESTNDLDTRSLGSIDDLNEIKPNQFINGDDKIYEVENDKQLSEISSGEFVEDCLSSDCMSYEAIFRQYDPLETSSLKSDTSFGTDSPMNSPRKQPRIRHKSHSSISDGSLHSPSKPSPRRCRIAAKFEQPLN